MALTRQLVDLRRYCVFLVGLHFIGATFYAVQPYFFITALNWTTKVIPLAPHPLLTERFWSIMAATMMYMLTACFWYVSRDVERYLDLLKVVLIGKITTATQFAVFFFVEHRTFAHLIGGLVDLSLFVSIGIFYLRARRSLAARPAAQAASASGAP
ncbi:MAG TPA: hypothetical protein VGQ83_36825 [Polyangia bacterium]|jgi:hypothetical protein